MDTRKRSLAKSIVWRIIAITVLGVVSYLVIGDWKQVTIITVLFNCLQVVFYYFHERVWSRISWGKTKHPLSDLKLNKSLTPEDLEIVKDKLKSLGYID